MDGDDGLGVKEPGGIGGVIRAHGEVIANGEEGVVDGIAFADELHIRKKPCVTGKIKDAAVKVDDEAAGVAACNAAAMEGQGEFDFAKREFMAAADMHGVGVKAMGFGVVCDFSSRDD